MTKRSQPITNAITGLSSLLRSTARPQAIFALLIAILLVAAPGAASLASATEHPSAFRAGASWAAAAPSGNNGFAGRLHAPWGLGQQPLPANAIDPTQTAHTIFQVSTINALLEGAYDGLITFGELRKHGDFGLGTFDTLDGEMVELDGKVYQIRSDGAVYPVPDTMTSPFAAITFFKADQTVVLDKPLTWNELEGYLDSLLPTGNIPYALRIDGEFEHIVARSVPSQSKPYLKLVDVVGGQSTFEFQNVKGTMVALRFPQYMDGLNVAGYHFHFIAQDRKAGGHVLRADLSDATIQIDNLYGFQMYLPDGGDFFSLDLTGDKGQDIVRVEQ
ncbi:MAG: acetolactate decarboxylase [Chloroflexi bacterium]|nr:acetolactate decarboxylase [Chloroflexota bacterium]